MMPTRSSNQQVQVCMVVFQCAITSFNLSTILHIGSNVEEAIDSKISNHQGSTRVDRFPNRDDAIPVEMERWFGDFPITVDKTVKDIADWDCMGEIELWFRMRPNDLPTSPPLQNWFRSLPLGRGRRVKDFESWRNMDVERGLWFNMRPCLVKRIPHHFGMLF